MKPQKITHLYGIIGNPLIHSYSPAFFQEKFKEKKMDTYDYVKFELPSIEHFPSLIEQYPQLRGLNVTIPYKQQVIPYLDALDEDARAIQAVNVIRAEYNADGSRFLKGYNSDWYGFKASLEPLLQPQHRAALVLGTGGAAKGILYALDKLGIQHLCVSRTAQDGVITYEELTPSVFEQYKIIINTTPVGTFPNVKACPEIPYQWLGTEHLVYDLIYNPIRSLFLHQAETKGASIQNGWPMFVYQALRSYEIWKGVRWTHTL